MNNWFSNIGNNQNSSIELIESWDDWLGPEDEFVAQLNDDLLSIYESLELESIQEEQWSASINESINTLKTYTPFQDDEDAWYGPNHSVTQLAWVIKLVEHLEIRDLKIPANLAAQMHWYKLGHWPCSYTVGKDGKNINDYIVY